MNRLEFGLTLKQARRKMKLSQYELGKKVWPNEGYSTQQGRISNLERGLRTNFKMPDLLLICKIVRIREIEKLTK